MRPRVSKENSSYACHCLFDCIRFHLTETGYHCGGVCVRPSVCLSECLSLLSAYSFKHFWLFSSMIKNRECIYNKTNNCVHLQKIAESQKIA